MKGHLTTVSKDADDSLKDVAAAVLARFNKRFDSVLNNFADLFDPIFCAATYLDPRLRMLLKALDPRLFSVAADFLRAEVSHYSPFFNEIAAIRNCYAIDDNYVGKGKSDHLIFGATADF